ncbi:MAG: hypothetical protein ACYTGB_17295 [Planctomycetota bacterium]
MVICVHLWIRGILPLLAAAALLPIAGCGSDEKPAAPAKKPVLKVSVMRSGVILADGAEIPPDRLEFRMGQVKRAGGVVWLYREPGKGVPPAEAMQVLNMAVKHALRVRNSARPDFSDLAAPAAQR